MSLDRRTCRLGAAALSITILGASGMALSANPAVAGALVTAVTTVSCSVTGFNWCISGNNSSSGIGVIGTSKTGTGLRGTSTSQYGLKATSGSGTAILAQTTSGPYGISASAGGNGYGVIGSGFVGAYGGSTSTSGYGVYGVTASGAGYGVAGFASGGTAVYGSALAGHGVDGRATTGIAMYGANSSGNGNAAILGSNTNGNAGEFRGSYIGMIGRSPANGFPIVATDSSGSTNLFYVDGSGDVVYKGGLFHVAATTGGAMARSFSPNSTQPTIEDTGTAQLVGGAAVVRLDPTFAASIDPATTYRVFVTPNGDTRGLFVATKTAAGFVVREAQAGRSTVTFDYRIVATALGQSGQHMALVGSAAAGFGPHAAAVAVPAASSAAVLAAPAPGPLTP